MIDIHTHILPALDDGSEDLDVSLEMAMLSVECRVDGVIATPHCCADSKDGISNASQMRDALKRFRNALKESEIPLHVYEGMEILGTENTASYFMNGQYVTLAGSRYPLVEFPFTGYEYRSTKILKSLVKLGLVPIVAHPERYKYVCDDPRILNLWVDMGCLLQINRGSLLGRFGMQTQALAHSLVERGFACFIASDAHGCESRTPWLRDVLEMICSEYSVDIARKLFRDNPNCVVNNKSIEVKEPLWF